MRSVIISGAVAALILTGCGSTASGGSSGPSAGSAATSSPATKTSKPATNKKAAELAKYAPALSAAAASVTNVNIDLGKLAQADAGESDLVTLGQDATTAHTQLKNARLVVVGNLDLFAAASDLTASMGTLGDLVSSPNDAGIAGKYQTQYGQASDEWNSAVDALCAAAGSSPAAKSYEVPVSGS